MNDRWRGLKDLVVDAVHHGATAVEVVHRRTARSTIEVIALVPRLAGPARVVGAVLDASVAVTYQTIRLVNGVVGAVAGLVMDAAAGAADDAAANAALRRTQKPELDPKPSSSPTDPPRS